MNGRKISRRFWWLNSLFLIALLVVLPRCGSKDSGGPASGTFAAVYTNTLSTACIQCHVPGQPAYDVSGVLLDFTTSATAYSTLTTKKVTGASTNGHCASVKIVNAGDPKTSYLMTVLFADYFVAANYVTPGCSPYPVHQNDTHLSAAEEASMAAWITANAPNN